MHAQAFSSCTPEQRDGTDGTAVCGPIERMSLTAVYAISGKEIVVVGQRHLDVGTACKALAEQLDVPHAFLEILEYTDLGTRNGLHVAACSFLMTPDWVRLGRILDECGFAFHAKLSPAREVTIACVAALKKTDPLQHVRLHFGLALREKRTMAGGTINEDDPSYASYSITPSYASFQ